MLFKGINLQQIEISPRDVMHTIVNIDNKSYYNHRNC